MMLHEIKAGKVANSKNRKRLGRGESSGQGRTSGRGNKGMGQRAGSGPRPTHEGGATPYYRKMPKRGFSNFTFRKEYQAINIGRLNDAFEAGEVVDHETLFAKGLIERKDAQVKILGTGSLTKALTVKANKFSQSAAEAIQAAGGKAEVIK
ncbi:MAG: 50S ribosomal protein L15 [Phycisphaerae bacterium]